MRGTSCHHATAPASGGPRNAGIQGGTESSNLLCSSGESATNSDVGASPVTSMRQHPVLGLEERKRKNAPVRLSGLHNSRKSQQHWRPSVLHGRVSSALHRA